MENTNSVDRLFDRELAEEKVKNFEDSHVGGELKRKESTPEEVESYNQMVDELHSESQIFSVVQELSSPDYDISDKLKSYASDSSVALLPNVTPVGDNFYRVENDESVAQQFEAQLEQSRADNETHVKIAEVANGLQNIDENKVAELETEFNNAFTNKDEIFTTPLYSVVDENVNVSELDKEVELDESVEIKGSKEIE